MTKMKMSRKDFRYLHDTLQNNMPAELWSRQGELRITNNASGYADARLICEWPGNPRAYQELESDLSRHGVRAESLVEEYWRGA